MDNDNEQNTATRAELDAELLHRIANEQCELSLVDLFNYYAPRLKSWLIGRGVDEMRAEDVIQDVMVTIWTRAHKFDPSKASFSTWLYRVTRNRWIDRMRKTKRLENKDPADMRLIADEMTVSVETRFMELEMTENLEERIAKLPTKQREIIRLAFGEDLTHVEIAERTGIALGTVKTRIRAAVTTLRRWITTDPRDE